MRWNGFLTVVLIAGLICGYYSGSVGSQAAEQSAAKATFVVR